MTNLLESVNDWSVSLQAKNKTEIAYIDFKRAFDSVSHPKLLHKLHAYGINGTLLAWIEFFLSNRIHCTRVKIVFRLLQVSEAVLCRVVAVDVRCCF